MTETIRSADTPVRDRLFTSVWPAATVVILVGSIIRLQQLTNTLNEAYGFRQTQTAFTVREFAASGIDVFHTPLPVFGPGADVPMEMPLFQAVAAVVDDLGVGSAVAARTVGLLSFQVSAVLLMVLVRRWHGKTAAVATLVAFEFLPFGLQWGASSMVDFFSVAFALLMVVGLDRWFDEARRGWLVVGCLAAIVGFLAKTTTAPSWGILLLVSSIVVVKEQGWTATWKRQLVGYLGGPGLGLMAALWWTHHADAIKNSDENTRFLTSGALKDWNFGTLDQRLELSVYARIFGRVTDEILGVGLLLVAVAAVLSLRRADTDRVRFVGWVAVAVSGPLVFLNLYWVHDYYLMAVYPSMVALVGISVAWLADRFELRGSSRLLLLVVAVGATIVSTGVTRLGRTSIDNFVEPPRSPVPVSSKIVLGHTEPDDLVVMVGCDWDPTTLYYAERRGVMFRAVPESHWAGDDIDDYSVVYSCDADLDPADYLPAGVVAVPFDDVGYLYRIENESSPPAS